MPKIPNQDNLVRTQFEKKFRDKHYFNLRNGTSNSYFYCFRNSMYNGYPRNKNNFSNKSRYKADLHRLKNEVCKTSSMHREEINNKKVTYRDNFLSEIGHNCGTDSTHKNQNSS